MLVRLRYAAGVAQLKAVLWFTRRFLGPEYAHALAGQALKELDRGKYFSARVLGEAATVADPTYSSGYHLFARALRMWGLLNDARAVLEDGLGKVPASQQHRLLTELGDILHDQGRFHDAERAWREALRLSPDPKNPHLLSQLAHLASEHRAVPDAPDTEE